MKIADEFEVESTATKKNEEILCLLKELKKSNETLMQPFQSFQQNSNPMGMMTQTSMMSMLHYLQNKANVYETNIEKKQSTVLL